MSLRIQAGTRSVVVQQAAGLALTRAAEQAGLILNTRCGFQGTCGGCTARLVSGTFQVGTQRVEVSPDQPVSAVACQTVILGDNAEVTFPAASLVERFAQIETSFLVSEVPGRAATRSRCIEVPAAVLGEAASDWDRLREAIPDGEGLRPSLAALRDLPGALDVDGGRVTVTQHRGETGDILLAVEPGDATAKHLGVAVDIGTTTVVVVLVNLRDGNLLGRASMYNQQIAKADDVASRITYADNPEQLGELQQLVVKDTLNTLLEMVCRDQGCAPEDVRHAVMAGNTIMSHLLLGLSPTGIGRIPFQPVTRTYPAVEAGELGLSLHPQARVDVVPSVAGYVGGDIVADIAVSDLHHASTLSLLVDIGTNGEIVVAEAGRMAACATAAGPAFEGYGIAHGCRAAAGAVERIRYDDRLAFDLQVIGEERPRGLCGSAIVDFIAEGLRCGLINRMGRFDRALLTARGRAQTESGRCGDSLACRIQDAGETATGDPLCVSELDISQVLKAKAAIYAGMKTLLASWGKSFPDVARFCLAGGFARHVDLDNAVTIGLLPDIGRDRYEKIGNGSLAGAYRALLDPATAEDFRRIMDIPHMVELNLQADFEPNFVDALALPNLQTDEFPSVVVGAPPPSSAETKDSP